MVFSSYIFLFYFLPAVLCVYYALPPIARRCGATPEIISRLRNGFLLLASYISYGWWNPWFIPLMFFASLANYVCGLAISRPGATEKQRFLAVSLGVAVSLAILGFFKYFMFFQTNLNHVLGWLGTPATRTLEITLPMGISFYIFHGITYMVDVYRREAPPARSLVDFACYIALYPQLVAGPIIRYNSVAAQYVSRAHTWERFSSGVALFVLGLGKKVLLANPVGQVADAAFAAHSIGALDAWVGVTAYAFQIYFDFAGYSDMAVGLGRMIGFEFIKNFDSPYRSESITEFWRRWHISLSSFLRDYLYIPLGGNRKGPGRTYVNLIIVMLLGGMWHGASWTFIAWGAYHGVLLAFERRLGKRSIYALLPRPARIAATFVLVLFSWVLFRSETIGEAARYFGAMFGAQGGELAPLLASQMYSRGSVLLMVLCAVIAMSPVQAFTWSADLTPRKALALAPLFILAVMAMFSQAFNPFLYFQF